MNEIRMLMSYLIDLQQTVYENLDYDDQVITYAQIGSTDTTNLDEIIKNALHQENINDMVNGQIISVEKKKLVKNILNNGFINTQNFALMPSPYEVPSVYSFIKRLSSKINEIIKLTNYKLSTHPIVGTLPTGQVNAVIIDHSDCNTNLILFESNLVQYIYLFSKILVPTLPIIPDSDKVIIEKTFTKISINHQNIDQLFLLLKAYLLMGNIYSGTQFFLEDKYKNALQLLVDSTLLFVLGHEYGHIIGNHFNKCSKKLFAFPAKKNLSRQEAMQIVNEHSQELEADTIGLELAMLVNKAEGNSLAWTYLGADFFFKIQEIIDRCKSIFNGEEFNEIIYANKTHPSPQRRRENLKKNIVHNFQNNESIDYILGLSEMIDYSITELWENNERIFKDMYKDGWELASRWIE